MNKGWTPSSVPNIGAVIAFNILELTGLAGMITIFLTAVLSRSVNRGSPWICFIVSWIISCISFSLLLLSGQFGKQNPNKNVCFAQAALVYAAPPLTCCTTGALVVPIWYRLRVPESDKITGVSRNWMTSLLAIPFLIWIAFVVVNFIFNASHQSLVKVNNHLTYCILDHSFLPNVTSIFVVAVVVIILALQVDITIKMKRNSSVVSKKHQPTSSIIRILLFSVLALVALGVGLTYSIKSSPAIGYDIAMACLPVTGVLIFGSQSDLWGAWSCRKRDIKYSPVSS